MDQAACTALREFDAWSRTYDRSLLQRLLFGPSHQAILTQLAGIEHRVLDIGCGTARFPAILAARFPSVEVWGLDLSGKMLSHGLERCRRWSDRVRLVRGDSGQLPFEDNRFDLVTCSHSFHHYADQQGVVAEMYRVLRPDGRLLLIDGDRDDWWGWFIFDVCVSTIEGDVHHCSAKRFRRLMENVGFEVAAQHRRGFFAPYLMSVAVARKQAAKVVLPQRAAA
jgi:SAM-dependent methyltransferase